MMKGLDNNDALL